MEPTFAVHFFAEVLVIGDQDPLIRVRLGEDIVVGHAPCLVVNRKHLVRLGTEPSCNVGASTLVNQKSHLSRIPYQRHEFGIRQGPRGKQKARLQILP